MAEMKNRNISLAYCKAMHFSLCIDSENEMRIKFKQLLITFSSIKKCIK